MFIASTKIAIACAALISLTSVAYSAGQQLLDNGTLNWEKESEVVPGKFLYENIFYQNLFGNKYTLGVEFSPLHQYLCDDSRSRGHYVGPECDLENFKDVENRFCKVLGHSRALDFKETALPHNGDVFQAFITKDESSVVLALGKSYNGRTFTLSKIICAVNN